MIDLALEFIKWLNETYNINISQNLISILLVAWPIWLLLIYIVLRTCRNFVRFLIPNQKEKQAMKIATEIADDSMCIDEKFPLWNDKQKVIDSYLSKLTFKENTNNKKIKLLNDGIKKLGLFSKGKKAIIKKRIDILEDANLNLNEQKNALNKISRQMKCFCKLKKANEGDIVEFGKHEWLVIKKSGKSLLLLNKFVVDVSWNINGWAEGRLRYLCSCFYKNLEENEKEIIKPINNKTQNENIVSKDTVFVLSPEEVAAMPNFQWNDWQSTACISGNNISFSDKYVSWRVAPLTEDAEEQLREIIYDYSDDSNGRSVKQFNETYYAKGWWLRSSKNEKLYIDGDGVFHNDPDLEICGFRPAVWVETQ